MSHSAKLLAYSITEHGDPLYTWEVVFPRIVLAELNTHRMLSRNSASSRAIPVEKMIRMVQENPYVPMSWGKNQKGMQAGEDLSPMDSVRARDAWLRSRDHAVEGAEDLLKTGVHKQLTNRLLEPFMWHTAIVSATDVNNLFNLRDHKDAHPDLRRSVRLMLNELSLQHRNPQRVGQGQWHLPYYDDEDGLTFNDRDSGALPSSDLLKASVGRCARVSYLTHDGKRDVNADIALADRMLSSGHMSPFEHVARPMTEAELDAAHQVCVVLREKATGRLTTHYCKPSHLPTHRTHGDYEVVSMRDTYFCGNFSGWMQYRKTIPYEHDILGPRG